MQFKIYPVDLRSLIKLVEEKGKVCCNVDGGRLKLGDIEICWSKRKELIIVKGKDITP